MESRTRTRTRTGMMGRTIYPRTADPGPFPYVEFDASIVDYIKKKKRDDGSTPPSNLNLMTRKVIPPGLTHYQKHKTSALPTYYSVDLPCQQRGAVGPYLSPSGGWSSLEPSDSEILFKGLSSSDPFRYEVSVPVMVAELVEVTALFRVQLASLGTAIGSTYLNTKFGWETLLQDIKTLTKLLGAIESRLREFNSLVSKGGVRRRISISKKAKTESYSGLAVLSNSYSTWYAHGTITYSSRVWLSVRWRPRRDKKVEVERLVASRERILSILLGLERNRAVTSWEVIPFSWLLDYFIDISDVLQSLENVDLVEPYDICIMKERKCEVQTNVIPKKRDDSFYGWSHATPGTVVQTRKLRTVMTSNVSAYLGLLNFGILTPNQAQTILALLYSRKRFS